MKIGVSKEEECELLWRFIASVSKNATTLLSVFAETRTAINADYNRLAKTDGDHDEPDWEEISKMLLSTTDGFMDSVKEYCLAYTKILLDLRESLQVSEETDEETDEEVVQ